jgi:hypothetical protein
MQVVCALGIDDFPSAFTGFVACNGPDGCARRHADGTTHCTDRRTGDSAAACSDASGQVVIFQIVSVVGVDDFTSALTGFAASQSADGSARYHADGAAHGANCRTSDRTAACADAGCQMMVAQAVGRVGVDDFSGALARHPACDGTNSSACSHANRAADGTNRGACDGTAGRTRGCAYCVLFRCAALRGVHAFGHAFACQTTGDGANGRTDDGADRACDHGADCSAGDRTAACAHTRANRVRAGLSGDQIFIMWIVIGHEYFLSIDV